MFSFNCVTVNPFVEVHLFLTLHKLNCIIRFYAGIHVEFVVATLEIVVAMVEVVVWSAMEIGGGGDAGGGGMMVGGGGDGDGGTRTGLKWSVA